MSHNAFPALRYLWHFSFLFAVLTFSTTPGRGQIQPFYDDLKQSRHAVAVKDGKLAGPGADVLREATADAQFVALGEDHGIQQIPEFAAALCEVLAPRGFRTLALETGPYATKPLEEFAKTAEGAKQLAEFDKKYPETIAFYTWREEFGFLQQCAKAAGPGKFQIWGLDQELMGSPVYLLQKILDTEPGPEARAAVEAMLKETTRIAPLPPKPGTPANCS